MQRRNARLRKEYLYKKSKEAAEAARADKKRKVGRALERGVKVPTELRKEYGALAADIEADDARTEELKTHVDDEYARAGAEDPRVLVTTARDPSSRLAQFAKELRLVFPGAQRINRGGSKMKELVEAARQNDMTDLVIVHEHRGQPDGMIVSHLPHGPTAYFGLHNCVLRHDLPDKITTMSEAFPHLIFHNFTTKLGRRTADILRFLFPVPREDTRRVMTFVNENDYISFRHHVYKRLDGGKEVDLAEAGPRFDLSLYQIKLGTVDMPEAENEWVLRPYMNSAKRQKRL